MEVRDEIVEIKVMLNSYMEKQDVINKNMAKIVEAHEKAINGNGGDGLKSKIARIETKLYIIGFIVIGLAARAVWAFLK